MSGSAITMMIIAVGVVWGGLITAVLLLRRHPEEREDAA